MNLSRARRRGTLVALLAATALPVSLLTLVPLAAQAAPLPLVTGRVVDPAGEPVEGAGVNVSGQHTRTDASGTFSLSAESSALSFNASIVPAHTSPDGLPLSQAASLGSVTLAGIEVPPEGLALGDVEVPVPSRPSALSVVDPDGDPIPFPIWTDSARQESCRAIERTDGATGSQCYTMTRGYQVGWRDGRLPFLLPESGAAELAQPVFANATVRLEDPATGRVYIERFSDAVLDASTGEYRLTVAGIDAPPIPEILSPQGVEVDPGHQQVRVRWTQPNSPVAILGHTVTATAPGHPSVSARMQTGDFLSGLTDEVTYTVRVVAHSEYRTDSSASEPVQVTPQAPTPNTPVIKGVYVDDKATSISVLHRLNVETKHLPYNPRCNGTIASTDGTITREDPLDLTSYGWTIFDVPAGLTYDIAITCTNDLGTATSELHRVTFGQAPRRPGRPTVKVTASQRATVSWGVARSNSGPVTYQVSWNGDSTKYKSTTRRRLVIKKVPVGRHRVQVLATNNAGTSKSPVRKIRVR